MMARPPFVVPTKVRFGSSLVRMPCTKTRLLISAVLFGIAKELTIALAPMGLGSTAAVTSAETSSSQPLRPIAARSSGSGRPFQVVLEKPRTTIAKASGSYGVGGFVASVTSQDWPMRGVLLVSSTSPLSVGQAVPNVEKKPFVCLLY